MEVCQNRHYNLCYIEGYLFPLVVVVAAAAAVVLVVDFVK